MNTTGIPDMTLNQTHAALAQETHRIAQIAITACADCERMQKRIEELENALRTILNDSRTPVEGVEFVMYSRHFSKVARSLLAKGN